MSIINRRNFLYLSLSVALVLMQKASGVITKQSSKVKGFPLSWDSIRKIEMKGDLKAFWNIIDSIDTKNNQKQAIQHGFKISTTPNTYVDYPGQQKETIYNFLEKKHRNPWIKPAFFEKVLKRNIKSTNHNEAIYVHDIEFEFEKDIQKAWQDPELRKLSQENSFKDFTERYYKEWASWFSLPCQWSKEMYPKQPVGVYGRQIFDTDYWGFIKPLEFLKIKQTHSSDLRLWKYIDPYVDFYICSVYFYDDLPDQIYALAANIEENYRLSKKFRNKPLYTYLSLKHQDNPKLLDQEIPDYLAEAAAVVPFFTGAKGIVLWGSEPKSKGQPYHNLPVVVNSLGRVADLSAKISRAKLVIDRPAHELWREKAPLIRKLKISEKEWLIMATHPWQKNDDRKAVNINCGKQSVAIEIVGKHTEIYHLHKDLLKKIPR